MKKNWYDGKELAIAFALALGLLSYWWYDNPVWAILGVAVGYGAGYFWQKHGK